MIEAGKNPGGLDQFHLPREPTNVKTTLLQARMRKRGRVIAPAPAPTPAHKYFANSPMSETGIEAAEKGAAFDQFHPRLGVIDATDVVTDDCARGQLLLLLRPPILRWAMRRRR